MNYKIATMKHKLTKSQLRVLADAWEGPVSTPVRSIKPLVRYGMLALDRNTWGEHSLTNYGYDCAIYYHHPERLAETREWAPWMESWIEVLGLHERKGEFGTLFIGNHMVRQVLNVEQGARCAGLSHYPFKGYRRCNHTRDLVVDHCHTTGFVRGLLCRTCNQQECLREDWRKANARYMNHEVGKKRWVYLHPWYNRPVINAPAVTDWSQDFGRLPNFLPAWGHDQ